MKVQEDMSGVLFTNEKKKHGRQPDYTGSVTINGVQYWISAWQRQSRGGNKYMSLAITDKGDKGARWTRPEEHNDTEPVAPPVAAAVVDKDFDDDIPF